MLILNPQQIGSHSIGGKARGLFALQAGGFPVPDFFVLSAAWFPQPLPQNWAPADPQKEEVLQALSAWNWHHEGLAVRSSMADEDGQEHAFPGMMDTVLEVSTEASLWTAIAQVAASAQSARALAYRQEKGLPEFAAPAVVIQKQLHPQTSGVLFTQNPTYPDELAIHAVSGLGEGLVSGQRVPYEVYRLRDSGEITHTEVGEEEATVLPEDTAEALHALGLAVERHFGAPQDIEYCVVDGDPWLVQARPITAPIEEVTVYDNSNIQESYCGVTTPLTFSFAKRAYATVYTQTMGVLGLPQRTIEEKQPIVQNLLGLVKGRIYYNINNWYRGLQLLPSFRQNKEDMERMMGLQDPVDFIEDRQKSLGETLRMLPGLLVNLTRLLRGFYRLPKLFEQFQKHFNTEFEAFYQQKLSKLSLSELWDWKQRLDRELMYRWTTPIINDFYVMMKNGSAMRALEKRFGAEAEEVLKTYVSGDVEIDSIKPTLAMMELAKIARKHVNLVTLIETTPKNVHELVEEKYSAFYEMVQEYIHLYGDRTVGELKLETQTMRVKPDIFYNYLRNYLQQEVEFSLHTEAAKAVASSGLQKKLKRLKRGIHRRESMRLERTRLFGMYRSLFLELGHRFAQANQLAGSRDIFYLEESEIEALVRGTSADMQATIAERKVRFSSWEKAYVPSRVKAPSRALQSPPPLAQDGILHGEVCVKGNLEGEAVVIERPEDNLDVKGKIICALRTDPGWAALFPVCKAVLIEKGSALSHSVILLRELGIPTLINIPGLTQAVKNGDTLRIHEDGQIHL